MDIKFVGFNFKKISVEKNKEIKKGVTVSQNVEIKYIKDQKSDLFSNNNLIYFEYEFKINYNPEYAQLVFSGGILAIIENKDLLKQIKDQWKEKKVPEDVRLILMNAIFSKCNLKALQLEEDLNLPSHFPFPKISKHSKDQ
jgi:hypothetical protein